MIPDIKETNKVRPDIAWYTNWRKFLGHFIKRKKPGRAQVEKTKLKVLKFQCRTMEEQGLQRKKILKKSSEYPHRFGLVLMGACV